MTKISSKEVQKSAEAVAVLYANWPAFRAWVRGRMASSTVPAKLRLAV
jgi:predicted phage tail protein